MSKEKEAQEKVLSAVPTKYRSIYVKAYSGGSKAAGVKAFCLYCTGDLVKEIRNCSSFACPLHPYRPYQNDHADGGEEGSEE